MSGRPESGIVDQDRPVFRFAPSPNGPLHLGHALSALTGFEMAQRANGRFLLRIEDIDVTRSKPGNVEAIFEDLAWLGISWEEPVLRQSEHFEDYKTAAVSLAKLDLLYPCFASRTEIVASGDSSKLDPEGAMLYPGIWRNRADPDVAEAVAAGIPYALRLNMERAVALARDRLGGKPLSFTEIDAGGRPQTVIARPERWGDLIVLRKEMPASYLLSVVVDDARQGITHVTRGQDLYAATAPQRLLQVLLGLPEPVYHHHRLILDDKGRKLSKSQGATGLAALRASGVSPDEVRALIGL